MPALFALTLFVGAALLFVVQPMIAKMVLPLLGGTPAVWNTCMVFFQAALLAGYAYAHASVAWLGVGRQAVLHMALLALPAMALPFAIAGEMVRTLPSEANPIGWLLGLLAALVGLPFLVVATTAPLLQRWFAGTGHPSARDPYYLYASSNLGSMLALLGYPLLIEPHLRLADQSRLWAVGYLVLAALVAACAVAVLRSRGGVDGGAAPIGPDAEAPRPSGRDWLAWIALAFVPSSLLLSVTTYLTTDIAAIPLLWVIPLALYLLTFILAFARRPWPPHAWMVRALPWAVVVLVLVLALGTTQAVFIPLHLLTFFLAAMVCHGELVRRRPDARHLTAFYLAMSIGGVLGGAFNALAAPVAFDRVVEYPLGLVLACLARRPSGPRRAGVACGTSPSPWPSAPSRRGCSWPCGRTRAVHIPAWPRSWRWGWPCLWCSRSRRGRSGSRWGSGWSCWPTPSRPAGAVPCTSTGASSGSCG